MMVNEVKQKWRVYGLVDELTMVYGRYNELVNGDDNGL